jgi:hypothetical protein
MVAATTSAIYRVAAGTVLQGSMKPRKKMEGRSMKTAICIACIV